MHIAVGNIRSTLRSKLLITLFLLGASTITNASFINTLSYNNDRINNICFQKYSRSLLFFSIGYSNRDWKKVALTTCHLTPKEINSAFTKKFN